MKRREGDAVFELLFSLFILFWGVVFAMILFWKVGEWITRYPR